MPAPEFVALADLLRGAPRARAAEPETMTELHVVAAEVAFATEVGLDESAAAEAKPHESAPAETVSHEVTAYGAGHADVVAAAREARLFRARLADAFDDALARLLRELAADVLARELRLAPCDVAAIARHVRERAPVVRVRVAPADAGCDAGLPVVVDPGLSAGDAVFELAGGALDARLGIRLATALGSAANRAAEAGR